jgi:uncharacterized protein with von Willebrand factor type A (vWA) domain
MLDATEALSHVDISRRDDVEHALRALFVSRHEDLPIFARAFNEFWRAGWGVAGPAHEAARPSEEGTPPPAPVNAAPQLSSSIDGSSPDADADAATEMLPTWSSVESLATRDFSTFTAEELALARAAFGRLIWQPGVRRTRRWIRGRGSRVDLRRALARSVRTGGDLVSLPRLRRRTKPRPLVLLCDVSGSMQRYSRVLLHFAHAIVGRHRRVEAFLFSTRLTRITLQLRGRKLDDALSAVADRVPDWSGGTRIGSALKQFHQRWGRRVMHGGPVVLLISDGWDRGDPNELRQEIARLQRSCRRLIWLNPLIGTADYAPLTRGLQAALPFVDDFLPARTLRNLADLAVHLNAMSR